MEAEGSSLDLMWPAIRYDVSEGVYVKLKLESPYNLFINVKKTARVLLVIKLGLYIDANTTGYITMKNVPVLWDVKP